VDPEPSRLKATLVVLAMNGAALLGIVLVVLGITSDDPPALWWLGFPLAVVCAPLAVLGMRFRMRSPEERQRYVDGLRARAAANESTANRRKVARDATRHKKQVLQTGMDGTAIVTFLADANAGDESRHLVYLELRVAVGGAPPYEVRTGEWLTPASTGSVAPGRELVVKVDPASPERVAVDWERSLRLRA
jgi:hypothetical protein